MKYINEDFLYKMKKNALTLVLSTSIISTVMVNANVVYASETETTIISEEQKPSITPIPSTIPTVTPTPKQLEKVYLIKKQITSKVTKLQKKYPKVPKNEIKLMVIGANLDYLRKDTLYSLLGIKSYTELKKVAEAYEEAIFNRYAMAFNGFLYEQKISQDKPLYFYEDTLKSQELFFDKNLIKQAKYFDRLVDDILHPKDDSGIKDDSSRLAVIDIAAYFFNYYSESFKYYSKGEIYKFGDKDLSKAAAYAIDWFTFQVAVDLGRNSGFALASYTKYDLEWAENEMREYIEEMENPFITKMNAIKKTVKIKTK